MLTGCRKWFLKELGPEGLTNMLAAYKDKSGQAVCTFAYCEGPGQEVLVFDGRTDVIPLPREHKYECLHLCRERLCRREDQQLLVSY